jgi:hypothetical protein
VRRQQREHNNNSNIIIIIDQQPHENKKDFPADNFLTEDLIFDFPPKAQNHRQYSMASLQKNVAPCTTNHSSKIFYSEVFTIMTLCGIGCCCLLG